MVGIAGGVRIAMHHRKVRQLGPTAVVTVAAILGACGGGRARTQSLSEMDTMCESGSAECFALDVFTHDFPGPGAYDGAHLFGVRCLTPGRLRATVEQLEATVRAWASENRLAATVERPNTCLLYTSDAADE